MERWTQRSPTSRRLARTRLKGTLTRHKQLPIDKLLLFNNPNGILGRLIRISTRRRSSIAAHEEGWPWKEMSATIPMNARNVYMWKCSAYRVDVLVDST